MANTYFRFKQFVVHQQHCAMKVCTDACLFAAWLASHKQHQHISTALDIGTGTGLLSLMLAQKINAQFDAVEIDDDAAMQARQNFAASNWSSRLQVHHVALQQFKTPQLYDLIFSNPPFYEHDLKSSDAKRNTALHSQQLTLKQLLQYAKAMLAENGSLALLLPFSRSAEAKQLADINGLIVLNEANVRQTQSHPFFRSMLVLAPQKAATSKYEEITIKINDTYSSEFVQLLSDYYLKL